MRRKATALAVLTVFVIFSGGCMTWGTRRTGTTMHPPNQGVKVISLVKRSGATVVFSRTEPGRFAGTAVVGTAVGGAWEQVELRKPLDLVKKDAGGRVYEIVDREGRAYPVGSVVSEDAEKIVFFAVTARPVPVSVPLAEIVSVKIRRFSLAKTALALVGLTALGYLAAFLILYEED